MFAGMYYYFSIRHTLIQIALPWTTVLFIHLRNTTALLVPQRSLGLTQSLKERLSSM